MAVIYLFHLKEYLITLKCERGTFGSQDMEIYSHIQQLNLSTHKLASSQISLILFVDLPDYNFKYNMIY